MTTVLACINEATYGGVYRSDDFTVSGAQPTWTLQSRVGLGDYRCELFRVDPFDPLNRYYVKVNDANDTYYRFDAASNQWTQIFDINDAIAGIGAGDPNTRRMSYLYCDPTVQGTVYLLYSWFSSIVPGTSVWVCRSDDYGASWAYTGVVAAARSGWAVQALGDYWYVSTNEAITGRTYIRYSSNGGSSWSRSNQIGTSGGQHDIYVDPNDGSIAWTHGESPPSANYKDLMKLVAGTATVQQDALDLAALYGQRGTDCIWDCLWIDPDDSDHQVVFTDDFGASPGNPGTLYYTTDGWSTYNSTSYQPESQGWPLTYPAYPVHIINPGAGQAGAILFGRSNDPGGPSPFSHQLYAFDSQTDTAPEGRSGDNYESAPYTDAIPEQGELAAWGIYAQNPAPDRGIYTYSVELGPSGFEEGIPLHGDRGVWEVLDYPHEHAVDIHDTTPIYHLGPSGYQDGYIPVWWDSSFFVPTPATAIVGPSLHPALTLRAEADTYLLDLDVALQVLGLDQQSDNLVFAGPSIFGPSFPSFRALDISDLPAIALNDLSDVSAASPADGQHLEYDSGGPNWVAAGTPITLLFVIAGDLAVGSEPIRIHAPRDGTISNVTATVNTAPTGASVIVDVNLNGTTIFTTQANRPTIAAGANDDLSSTPDVTSFSQNDVFTIDVDQIGSGTAGADLVLQIRGTTP